MELVAETFDELFVEIVSRVNNHSQYVSSPRGSKIREVIAPTLILKNPRARVIGNSIRAADYGFATGEFLWFWNGKNDLETMLYYNKRMKNFSDDGFTLNSAYGYRLRVIDFYGGSTRQTQWESTKRTLLADRDSRRAVMTLGAAADFVLASLVPSKDVPCTLSLQFFIRGGKLHLHTHMRSNDVFWGLTYDIFSFTIFQECMLLELRAAGMNDLDLGEYVHTAGSLHIYERHFEISNTIGSTSVDGRFQPAAPMEPIDLEGLSLLADQEEALRSRKVAQLNEDQFRGGTRWLAFQLNQHRRKRDAEQSGKIG